MNSAAPQYTALGGFRFLLALLVFCQHGTTLDDVLKGFINGGTLGISAFFLVSGFIIFSAHADFYRNRLPAFAANRFLKIFPLLWVTLLFSLLVLTLVGGEMEQMTLSNISPGRLAMAFSAFGGGLDSHAWDILPPGWTITIEVQFYAIAFVLFWLHDRGSPAKWVFPTAAAGVVLFYAYIVADDAYHRFFGGFRFAPLFLLGAGVFYLRRGSRPAWGAVVAGFAGSLHCIYVYSGGAWADVAGFVVLFVLFLVCLRLKPGPFWRRWDKRLGDLTYAVYLVHRPLIGLLVLWGISGGFSAWILGFALVMFTASVLHGVCEVPLIKIRDAIRRRSVS